MTLKMQMDTIVQAAIADILSIGEADQVNLRILDAIDALDNLMIQTNTDQNHQIQSKQALADAQMNLGLDERDALLSQLATLTQQLASASKTLDASAADNLMLKIASDGTNVLNVVSQVNQLTDALKQAVDSPQNASGETLATNINTVLEALQGLKAP